MMNRWDFFKALYIIIPNINQAWPISVSYQSQEMKERKGSSFSFSPLQKFCTKLISCTKMYFLMHN